MLIYELLNRTLGSFVHMGELTIGYSGKRQRDHGLAQGASCMLDRRSLAVVQATVHVWHSSGDLDDCERSWDWGYLCGRGEYLYWDREWHARVWIRDRFVDGQALYSQLLGGCCAFGRYQTWWVRRMLNLIRMKAVLFKPFINIWR